MSVARGGTPPAVASTTAPAGATAARARTRRRARQGEGWTYVLLSLGAVIILAPVAWGLLTSIKPERLISSSPPHWLPWPITFEHYHVLLTGSGVPRFLLNSFVLALGSIVVCLSIATPAAYAFTRFRFAGRRTLLFAILATSMIPGISVLVPIYLLSIRLDLLNNYGFIICVYSAWLVPQAVWFIKGFIDAVPGELEEAAKLDGCGTLGVFVRIVLPLIQPGLAAVALLVFIFVWNDFLIGAVLITDEGERTVQVGLVRFIQDPVGVWWGQFMAFAMLAIAPVLASFAVLQRRFIEGLTSGGIKG